MIPFTRHTGLLAILPRENVDTDQIMPKQFLKRIERTGFGPFVFFDWRFRSDGSPDPSFELNHPTARGASILVTGANFGCGSSREHAVWGLAEYGFRAILAPSFSEIFYNNCCRNGLLPALLAESDLEALLGRAAAAPVGYQLTVDLESQRVGDATGWSAAFSIDPYRRDLLLQGLDEIGRTLGDENRITEYELRRASSAPAS